MTIALTVPLVIPAYAGQRAQVLPEVKIVDFKLDLIQSQIFCTVEYGETVGGVWVGSSLAAPPLIIENTPAQVDRDGNSIPADPAYDTFRDTTLVTAPQVGAPVYEAVKTALYTYMIANVPDYAGTIV